MRRTRSYSVGVDLVGLALGTGEPRARHQIGRVVEAPGFEQLLLLRLHALTPSPTSRRGSHRSRTSCVTRSGAASAVSSTARPPNDVPTSAAGPSNTESTYSASESSPCTSGVVPKPGSSGREHEVLAVRAAANAVPFAGVGDARVDEDDLDNRIIIACGYAARRVVRRSLSIFLLLALFCVPHALAQDAPPTLLMPGVTYAKRVQFTPHGPVVLNVVTAPKPGGLYSLAPVLSNETLVGREKLTDMQKRLSATATTVGVNGDYFNVNDGRPSGVLSATG